MYTLERMEKFIDKHMKHGTGRIITSDAGR
jgi:hypothetical protein